MEQNIATARGFPEVARPNFWDNRLVSRIVHLGCGAFHRARTGRSCPSLHGKSDSDWGICE